MVELYEIFAVVAEEGSISKAAKRLYVTQPAVSKSIKNLEEGLGLSLFRRNSKGVELSSEGEVLYKHVSQAFVQLHEGEKLVKQLRDRTFGVVRIGVSNTLCKYYFLPHLEAFHQKYPNLKIEIINRTSTDTLKLLEEGRMDCAVISEMAMDHHFVYEKLMVIQDIFVSRKEPPLDALQLKDLVGEPMLLLEKKNATRDYLDAFLIEHQVELNVDIEISSMEFLVEFAKIGLGVASVIGDFIKEDLSEKRLYEWQVKPMIPKRSIGLMYMKGAGHSIACQTFIDFMLDRREK